MAKEDKSTILIATISAISAIVVAIVTTYGTIAISEPAVVKTKEEINSMQIANLPVGTIIPSMLNPTKFAEAVGDVKRTVNEWVLADGQTNITKSRYGQLTEKTTPPDLRGMFLRGINAERNDRYKDPEDRSPGEFQVDAIQQHSHNTDAFKLGQYTDKDTKELGYTSRGGADANIASVTSVTGEKVNIAEETRPRNVAVYFYIKIN